MGKIVQAYFQNPQLVAVTILQSLIVFTIPPCINNLAVWYLALLIPLVLRRTNLRVVLSFTG